MKIMVVDDEKNLRWAAKKALKAKNYDVLTVENGEKALDILKKELEIKVVILDIKMPGISGIEVLKKIKEKSEDIFVIMISAFGNMDTTIEAMKNGAYDFLLKPFDIDNMLSVVEKACEAYKNIERVSGEKKNDLNKENIIGRSLEMQEIYKLIGKIASSDVTVLVTGESGAGKEVIARAIHYNSLRAKKPFMALNCTAMQETLIESELFGHEKGAFTGAYTQKLGKFELANGGTVFLDEIGDMSPELQAKLLRVMEEKRFVRVGGVKEISVDIRIVAATNKNLEKAIIDGSFREDLYHRIKVIHIKIPPLRERKEDIEALVKHFLAAFSMKNNLAYQVSNEAMQKLKHYDWPGNVRELKNTIESAIALCRDGTIFPEHILISEESQRNLMSVKEKDEVRNPLQLISEALNLILEEKNTDIENALQSDGKLYSEIMDEIEKIFLEKIYNKLGNNQLKTSRVLGINRNTLRSKIEKYDL
ncbi:MAG: sigma-54-dependent transcriptional regulator [Candidatus Muiribacteriota bacterium]